VDSSGENLWLKIEGGGEKTKGAVLGGGRRGWVGGRRRREGTAGLPLKRRPYGGGFVVGEGNNGGGNSCLVTLSWSHGGGYGQKDEKIQEEGENLHQQA